jgi:hypothetical protein
MANTKIAPAPKSSLAFKRRAKALVAYLQSERERMAESFYDIGIALRELEQDRLYASLGYRTLAGLVAANRIGTGAEAACLMAIVDHLSRKRAYAIGLEAAIALAKERGARGMSKPPPLPSAASRDAVARKLAVLVEKRSATEAARLAAAFGRRFRRRGIEGAFGEAHVRKGIGWVVRIVLPLDAARSLATMLDL